MKLTKLLAALFALALVAAACGSTADVAGDLVDDAAEAVDDAAEAVDEAVDGDEGEDDAMEDEGEDDAMEDEAMEDEEAMEDDAGTVVDVAVASGEFPTLVAALQATGLDEVLAGEGPFTVFAPTEDAFAAALEALGVPAEELLADEGLADILTYHVLPTEAPASAVVTLDGQEVETVNGATVLVTIDGESVLVNEANVVQTDIEGSNGVIHVIDSVLLPPEG